MRYRLWVLLPAFFSILYPGMCLDAEGLQVRVSVKRILDATDERPTDGFFYLDSQIEEAIDSVNELLEANNAEWKLDLVEVVDVRRVSQWYNISGHASRTLESVAMNNPTTYYWRDDAINIYVTRLTDWRGFCSIPDATGATDIIIINNDAWFISPSPLPMTSLPDQDDLRLASGYLWLHEISHYFNLCHTQGCCCGFVCGAQQDPASKPVDDDHLADTLRDLECWGREDIASGNFGETYSGLSPTEKELVDGTFLNVMSYHREAIFEAGTAILTSEQLDRMSREIQPASGRRAHVMNRPRAGMEVSRGAETTVLQPFEASAASSSAASGQWLVSWKWDFGDGTLSHGETVTHRYLKAGLYTIRLTVTDNFGLQSTTEQLFRVHEAINNVWPWNLKKIGTPEFGGAALLKEDCLVVAGGGGESLGFYEDSFHFTQRAMPVDVSLTARIAEVSPSSSESRARVQAGILFRESLEAEAPFVGVFAKTLGDGTKNLQVQWMFRTRAGEKTTIVNWGVLENPWFRVERRKDLLTGFLSTDGKYWIEVGRQSLSLPEMVPAGVAVASTGSPVLASFGNLSQFVAEDRFRRGDTDNSGRVDIADALFQLLYVLLGQGEVSCLDATDSNDDGISDFTDAILILTTLFLGGEIPAPGPFDCGTDSTEDDLDCEAYLTNC